MLVEIASRDFPNQREPSIGAGTRGKIPRSRDSNRGFQQQGKLVSWIRDPRNPDGDVGTWDHEI
jgi:hypothetical protein